MVERKTKDTDRVLSSKTTVESLVICIQRSTGKQMSEVVFSCMNSTVPASVRLFTLPNLPVLPFFSFLGYIIGLDAMHLLSTMAALDLAKPVLLTSTEYHSDE